MGATTTLVTVREFLELPEPEGQRIELIGGEVVSMPRAGWPHECTKSNLIQTLAVWLAQNKTARLFVEAAYDLDEHNCLIPDVSLLSTARFVPGATGIFEGAPDLAIEVVSSETAARLDAKIDLYLTHGSKSVWVVFPESRSLRVFDASGRSQRFELNQTLEDPNVLPGFQVPVAAIFEDV